MIFPPAGFIEYISPNCNRAKFIQNYLAKNGVQSVDINIGGKRHIYVKFPSEQYNPHFKIKTVIAHYDRVPNSPGANDNSAADFCLMDWAVRLNKNFSASGNRYASGNHSTSANAFVNSGFHNVRLLFTDGEELGSHGVTDQGSFALAAIFRRLGMTRDDVYVFDCMGRGAIPVIGKNNRLTMPSLAFQKQLANLENKTKDILRSCCGRWLSLPISYSDNAGFVACGIPAIVITMLPATEADNYIKALMKEKRLESFVLRRADAGCFDDSRKSEIERRKLEMMLPETWRLFHTKYDNAESLTAESFDLTAKILDALALEKTLAK